jgi:hypothetical protein
VIVAGGEVDAPATAAERDARRGGARVGAGAPFDFGPARREHERRWPPALQDAFIALLMGLPAPYRAYVRRTLHARATAVAPARSLTADDLRRLWRDLQGIGFS